MVLKKVCIVKILTSYLFTCIAVIKCLPTYMYVNIIYYDNIKNVLILIIHGTYRYITKF